MIKWNYNGEDSSINFLVNDQKKKQDILEIINKTIKEGYYNNSDSLTAILNKIIF